MEGRLIIVTAPNETGRNFVKLLMFKKLAFAVLTNSAQEERQLKKNGCGAYCAHQYDASGEMEFSQKRNWLRVFVREQLESDVPFSANMPAADIRFDLCHYTRL